MSRRVEITTPFGTKVHFRRMIGTEALSSLHEWEIDLISDSRSLDHKQALGQHATLTVETQGLGKRYLDGIVTQFGMHGQDTGAQVAYRMILSPWLWLATRKSDFKIWQNLTVPQIIESVLEPFGKPMEFKLGRSYRRRDYTVQYNESCYDFVARLCESEGIYWRYVHQPGSHTAVFCDDVVGSHEPLPGGDVIPYYPPGKIALADKEHIYGWQSGQEVRPGRSFLDDHDFKKPRADLSNALRDPPGHSHDQWESYVWPGGYTEHADGETYTRMQLQTDLARQQRAQLTNYPREDQNRQYLVVGVSYHFQENVHSSEGGGGVANGGSMQQFAMEAHPTSVPYRPETVTPKPRTQGPQTAVVVGPAGEEIWTDQYGRVKVQFHWDRVGAMNEKSSCWVRVSTSWAGPQFGAIHIPRIGMEVIVDFLNGDPDYPIILGCVYNAVNMPPWSLPANATQSGILTRSSKGGAPGAGMGAGGGDANALRFEDKKGQELLWAHAEKDFLSETENDESKWVGRDRRKTVDRDEINHIGRDRTETVDRDETITVHNHRSERVDHNEKISIGDNRDEDVGLNETIAIGRNRTETVGLNESVTVGKNQTFNVGDNRSKSVGKNEKDSIGKNWSINVGKFKTETIGMAYMQNVGLGRMENVGLGYNLNVGAVMATVVGLNQSTNVAMNKSTSVGKTYAITAADEFSVTVGKSVLVMKKDGTITLNGHDLTVSMTGEQVLKADGNITMKGAKILEN